MAEHVQDNNPLEEIQRRLENRLRGAHVLNVNPQVGELLTSSTRVLGAGVAKHLAMLDHIVSLLPDDERRVAEFEMLSEIQTVVGACVIAVLERYGLQLEK